MMPTNDPPSDTRASALGGGIDAVRLLNSIVDSLARTAVWLFDSEGRIAWCSRECSTSFGAPDPNALIGKRPRDLLPPGWAGERETLIRRAYEENRRFCLLSIIGGKRKAVRFVPVSLLPTGDERGSGPSHVMVLVEPAGADRVRDLMRETTDDSLVLSRIHDLGSLDVLSPRELEVLALLGQGMRSKEIARTLNRSLSTVEGHRERIGAKLNINDRAQLVALAREAALLVEDAECERIRFYTDEGIVAPPKDI